jgi:hypothetical protein
LGELFFNSEGKKQDAGNGQTGKDETTDGNMETMETYKDEELEPSKVRHQSPKGL